MPEAGSAYPVVYFLHGLPASSLGPTGTSASSSVRSGASGARRSSSHRRGARSPTPTRVPGLGSRTGTGSRRSLASSAYVDSHFRTIPDRRARALVGLSAGGYGAAGARVSPPESFGVVESWSGYFHPTNPSGTKTLDLGSAQRNHRANLHSAVAGLRHAFRVHPTFFGFYVGRGDARFRTENLALHRSLSRQGFRTSSSSTQAPTSSASGASRRCAWPGWRLRTQLLPRAAPPAGLVEFDPGCGGACRRRRAGRADPEQRRALGPKTERCLSANPAFRPAATTR